MVRAFSFSAAIALLFVVLALGQVTIQTEAEEMNYLMVFQNIPKAAPFLSANLKDATCKKQLLGYKEEVEALMQREQVQKPTEDMVKNTFCKIDRKCIRDIGKVFKSLFAEGGGMTEKLARQYFGEKGIDLQSIDKAISGYAENVLCVEHLGSKSQEL